MNSELEVRKRRYVEAVEAEYQPQEKSYWQHPPPSYQLTKDYATRYDKPVNTEEPVIIKKTRKEWMIATIMIMVAALLLYLLGENKFGLGQVLFLVLLLIVVLPWLLNNKALIRISRESIWLYKEDKEIQWKHVLLTYIKTVHEETSSSFFIIHYYDDNLDEFYRLETALNGLISPGILSTTIEAFRPPGSVF
ncbi:MAG: hypothetical protein ABI675_08330 [Chitinophagaceae bacterium]